MTRHETRSIAPSFAPIALAVMAVFWAGGRAEAQTVTVQGEVQVPTYGRPQGPATPPPGYGQPPQAPTYQQPQQPQPPYQVAPQPRQVRYEERGATIKGLWIPGVIIFGASYGLTGAFGSLSADVDFSSWSYLPLVGPWVALSYTDSSDEAVGAVIGGILQAAGLTMLILGLAIQKTVRVAVYSLDEHDAEAPQLALDLLPAAGGGRVGLTLSHF